MGPSYLRAQRLHFHPHRPSARSASLGGALRAMRLEEDRGNEQEERQAREHAATVALTRLDEVADQDWVVPEQLERMRLHYGRRLQRYAHSGAVDAEYSLEAADAFRRLRHEAL